MLHISTHFLNACSAFKKATECVDACPETEIGIKAKEELENNMQGVCADQNPQIAQFVLYRS